MGERLMGERNRADVSRRLSSMDFLVEGTVYGIPASMGGVIGRC